MTTKKFNCTFSVRETIEKTYIITNLPINISEEDLASGVDAPQILKDNASDIIRELFFNGVLTFVDKGALIQTDTNIDFVEFVIAPKEIKED